MKKSILAFALIALAGSLIGCTDNSNDALEARLEFLEDQYAIEQLVVVKYGNALDALDGDAYSGLFTADGVLDMVGNVFDGQEEIKAMFTGFDAMLEPPPAAEGTDGATPPPMGIPMPEYPGHIVMQHVITNMSYQIEGNKAEGRSYFQEITTIDGKSQILNSGHYDDTLLKEDGIWKFVRRNIMQDAPPPSAGPPGER